MKRLEDTPPPTARAYRFQLPPLLALALAPLALFFLGMVAIILLGGLAAAILLPPLMRRLRPAAPQDGKTIELRPEDYRTLDHRGDR